MKALHSTTNSADGSTGSRNQLRAIGPVLALIGLAGGMVEAGPAAALSITQTKAYNISGLNTATLNFNRFDATAGKLTAINFTYSGTSSGYFKITNTRTTGLSYTLNTFTETPIFAWGTASQPEPSQIEPSNPLISYVPGVGSPANKTVAINSSKTFTLINAPTSSDSLSFNDYFNYFTGSTPATLDIANNWNYNATADGKVLLDPTNLAYSGNVTLEYVYEIPVPAPLPALGAMAGYGFLRRQRRRLKANR